MMDAPFDTPEQQALWTTLRALNACWTRGDPADLVHYFHPDMVAITATDRLRRLGRADCLAGWQAFADAATIHHWREHDPLIQVYGDAAVISYYYDMAFDLDGRHIETGGRDMYVFVRENGRWWAVADQFSSYPA